MNPHNAHRPARNIVTLDQEKRSLVAVIDGADPVPFHTSQDLDLLPAGGGLIVADANVWSINNGQSQSQYCWAEAADRQQFLDELADRGYTALLIPNVHANRLYLQYGYEQADAVAALYAYVHDQVKLPAADGHPVASCGCTHHRSFDAGHQVRVSSGDNSFGVRAEAKGAFLRLQNSGGYDSAFAYDVVQVAWDALDGPGRKHFMLKARTPECTSLSRLMAVAACTHDPETGRVRTHQGRPLGVDFIVKRVIGLNGMMRGTGERAPGNPMRAVLRVRGMRGVGRRLAVDKDARAELDRYVRVVVRALQQHEQLSPTV